MPVVCLKARAFKSTVAQVVFSCYCSLPLCPHLGFIVSLAVSHLWVQSQHINPSRMWGCFDGGCDAAMATPEYPYLSESLQRPTWLIKSTTTPCFIRSGWNIFLVNILGGLRMTTFTCLFEFYKQRVVTLVVSHEPHIKQQRLVLNECAVKQSFWTYFHSGVVFRCYCRPSIGLNVFF